MGSKIEARRLMMSAGVPVVPARRPTISPITRWRRRSRGVGFPAVVKASAGGRRQGMREVRDSGGGGRGHFRRRGAKRWPHSATGPCTSNGSSIRPRHVEVQIFADHQGAITHLFERECFGPAPSSKGHRRSPSAAADARAGARE